MTELRFDGVIVLDAVLECLTGLRIGASAEEFEIGGLDNPVIKDPLTGKPYIPGSSLKGKMRSLLEWALGKLEPKGDPGRGFTAGPCSCAKKECPVCLIFGVAAEKAGYGPTRLVMRDALPTQDTEELWETVLGPRLFTEMKSENTIDRAASRATPRTMERVPAGSRFNVQMVYFLYDPAHDQQYFEHVLQAMALLEDSTLGGSGTRGYGRVRFRQLSVTRKPVTAYLASDGEGEQWAAADDLLTLRQALASFMRERAAG